MRTRRVLTLFGLLLFFVSQDSASAQTARRNFNRARAYDAEHYIVRVQFDRPAKKVLGDTTIRFRPLTDNFTTAEFDSVGISYTSVVAEPAGTSLKFRTAGDKVVVTLDRSYSAKDTVTLRFKHSATPRKGVYFVEAESENGREVHSEQIWTQGEADEARHWFPSFDFPSDKATFEQFITANDGETVIGNGEVLETAKAPDGKVIHHFRMNVPSPTYLLSFVIGKYIRVDDKYRDVPLGYYVYPGGEPVARKAYGNTREMMRVFESLTGVNYPFNKYDQTVVAGFAFGGMENITATTMADTEIYSVNHPLFAAGVEDLVSHELAHSWFGNLVTCKNWAELWLNEGFATFMEASFREKMYGRRNYLVKILRDAQTFIIDDEVHTKRNALFNQNADNIAELFDRPATIYSKGGAVLHTLREEIGNEAFWKGVNIYLNRHKFGNVESSDLQKAMEEASGRDLAWFFDQWVYMGGYPKLDVKQAWNPSTSTLAVTVSQVQKVDRLTPAAFRLPMDVDFVIGTEKRREKLNVSKRTETFSYKLAGRPKTISVDPDDKIPVKTVRLDRVLVPPSVD
jgi:aminopeptidase N